MAYQDGHAPSFGPKLLLTLFTLLGVMLSAHLMFGKYLALGNWFTFEDYQGNFTRQILILSCCSLFFVRETVCLFVFIKRKISWFEGSFVSVLYCILLIGYAYWGSKHLDPIDICDIFGILFFVFGSSINTIADYQRHIWKNKEENKGRLYTKGLFQYAMHINFFGDTIMFTGFTVTTHDAVSLIPLAGIIMNFLIIQMPMLDDYLSKKYGKEFKEYSKQTKKFIPFVY